jgi:SpoVK/Ycf46/Vps4 family AAA+-type ATPase
MSDGLPEPPKPVPERPKPTKAGRAASPPGNAQHILALMRAHLRGEHDHFLSVSLQIAADAARKGHSNVAEDIRSMVADARNGKNRRAATGYEVPTELKGLVTARKPRFGLERLTVSDGLRGRMRKILRQQCAEGRAKLAMHGLPPESRFLLTGPPGTGKTITAEAFAGELGLPFFTVALDGLITKYMGETGAKIGVLFEAIAKVRGVYLLDEFDALAASRDRDDVGEARRILNVLLVRLEGDIGESLLFAATNLPEMLDRANFRRFDARLAYDHPTAEMVRPVVAGELPDGFRAALSEVAWPRIETAAAGMSHSEIARAALDAARDAVLDGNGEITTDFLLAALTGRAAVTSAEA